MLSIFTDNDQFNLQGTLYTQPFAAGPAGSPGQGFAMHSSKALKKEQLQLHIYFFLLCLITKSNVYSIP